MPFWQVFHLAPEVHRVRPVPGMSTMLPDELARPRFHDKSWVAHCFAYDSPSVAAHDILLTPYHGADAYVIQAESTWAAMAKLRSGDSDGVTWIGTCA